MIVNEHKTGTREPKDVQPAAEHGFMLLGLIVAIALILLVLGMAAPVVARNLRRDRNVEAVHRGNQYVRAIQLYYKKFGHYPGSIGQLEKTNNIRFLRQRYLDPVTGKDDWRMIPVGQNKTTVKWFFGQPLAGLPTVGVGSVGSVASMISPGIGIGATPGATTAAGTGAASTTGTAATGGAAGTAGTPGAGAAGGTAGASGPTDTSASGSGSPGIGSQSAATFSGTGAPFMGVGLDAPGDSIVEFNEQTTYATWEFLYDPRLDQMKAKALAANGAGLGSTPAGSLGQSPSGIGNTGAPGATGTGGAATPGSTGTGTGTTGTALPPQPQQ